MRLYFRRTLLGIGLLLASPLLAQHFVPGELLVRTKEPWRTQTINTLTSKQQKNTLGFEIEAVKTVLSRPEKNTFKRQASMLQSAQKNNADAFYVYTLTVSPDLDILTTVQSLPGQRIGDNEILVAQPNYRYKLISYPTDASGYENYQSTYMQLMNMEDAWPYTTGSADVVIAIIDSGIDTDHQEFAGQLWQNPGEIPNNFIDDDNNGLIDDIIGYNFVSSTNRVPEDDLGHGTHVSGIAASKGVFLTGVCPGCKIMSVKAANAKGDLYDSEIISAIGYAVDNGANIVNMSFGGYGQSTTTRNLIQALIDDGHENGIVFVAAMGNENINTNTTAFYPAALNHVLAISSVDTNRSKSSFSNFGSVNFIAAPGKLIPAAYPSADITITDEYTYLSGTSMAAPQVSGIIGLMKSIMPWLTPDEIRTALQVSAQDVGSAGHDIYYGYGIVDANMAIRYADTIPATLSDLTAPSAVSANETISIDVTATDNMDIMEVRLYYRYYEQNTAISDWAFLTMSHISGSLYSGDIPVAPSSSTSVQTYVAGYDLHPSNPTLLPAGAPATTVSIAYPEDIAAPNIVFTAQTNDFIETQAEAWVTDNYGVVTASISVSINTGIDKNVFDMDSPALSYSDEGLLTITISETGLSIPEEGAIQIRVSASDTSDNSHTYTHTYARVTGFAVIDGNTQTDSFLTYPNPFNPQIEPCIFSYQLSKDSEMQISIYSLAMKEVRKLTVPSIDSLSGYHEYSWDGRDSNGNLLPNGVYLAVMSLRYNGEKKVLRRHIAIKR
jgi:subtilisin family serine protease